MNFILRGELAKSSYDDLCESESSAQEEFGEPFTDNFGGMSGFMPDIK